MLDIHYIHFGLLTLFGGFLVVKLIKNRLRGSTTTALGKGKKACAMKCVEGFMLITCYPLLFLWAFNASGVFESQLMITNQALRHLGTLLVFIGLVIYMIAIHTLNSAWRIGIDATSKAPLITHGIYAYSRNPAYLGYVILFLGLAVSFAHTLNIILVSLSITALVLMAKQEETFLLSTHHDAYLQYKKKVRFLI